MKKWMIALLFMIALVLTLRSQELLKILNPDSTAQYFEIRKLSNLTFNDSSSSVLTVNKLDGSKLYFYIDRISDLTFSDLSGTLSAPSNISISIDSTSAVIRWDNVPYASQYYVYRSETDPYSGFIELGNTPNNVYTDINAVAGNKYFYKVIAKDW
ncbi:MAG TPA: hypothetical protein PKW56_03955 [Clostridiales bacterium]|nr:hypothetical protein [Clostridiales bacterium]